MMDTICLVVNVSFVSGCSYKIGSQSGHICRLRLLALPAHLPDSACLPYQPACLISPPTLFVPTTSTLILLKCIFFKLKCLEIHDLGKEQNQGKYKFARG
jgi:hypothetical protein